MVNDTGKLIERSKFSAYGTPFGLPSGDSNSDGAWDATDSGNVSGTPPYTIQCDADLSGAISAADATHANSIRGGFQTLGRGKLSSVAIYSRLGYAGYQYDPTFQASRQIHHVRHRVLDSGFGRWLRRDPIGYHDGMGLYEYAKSSPIDYVDEEGLASTCGTASCKAKCMNPLGVRYATFRFFIPEFCGTQGEANLCCNLVTSIVCACFPPPGGYLRAKYYKCYAEGEAAFIACIALT